MERQGMKKWQTYLAAIAVCVVAFVGYYFYWQAQAEQYKAAVLSMLDSIKEQSGGAAYVKMEGVKVSGFPLAPKVSLVHSSLLSDMPGKEYLEIHSHDVSIVRRAGEDGGQADCGGGGSLGNGSEPRGAR